MLRKEMRDFLQNEWLKTQYEPGNPNLKKLRTYKNPSLYYKRIVNQANRAFGDLHYILDRLPLPYRQQVQVSEGLETLMLHARKNPKDNINDALVDAFDKIVVAMDTIEKVKDQLDDGFYAHILYPKIMEIQSLASLCAKKPSLIIKQSKAS